MEIQVKDPFEVKEVFMYWGYVHENGTFRTKRFYSEEDIKDAKESPFVKRIYGPVAASNMEEASEKLTELTRVFPG